MDTVTTAWLFPGQGSQFVGMGHDLFSLYPPARELMEKACEISEADLFELVSRGPDALLTRTDNLQPALAAVSLGCAAMLEEAGYRPRLVAGHSLGEFPALYAAKVLSADDVLRLVTERGRLMHAVASSLDGGMLAIKDLDDKTVEAVIEQIDGGGDLCIANYNGPTQTVVSGIQVQLAHMRAAVAEAGGRAIELNVSGPWHSPLLEPAAARFAELLENTFFSDAAVPVVLNVTGNVATEGRLIQHAMMRQLCSPVRWLSVLEVMRDRQVRRFLEVGPGKVLRGLLRGTPELAASEAVSIDGPRALRFLKPKATTAASVAE